MKTEKKETYNGWANYETWVVKLWMDNEQGSQEFFREMTKEVIANPRQGNKVLTDAEYALIDLADALKEHFEDNTPETVGIYADLLNAALSEVDWREIAEALLEDANEEVLK